MADRSGQQLGNYRVIRQIGRGGFAEVYLGEHFYLKTQVAIKLLRTTVANPDDLEDFLKEARTVASLVHPNIVRVIDFGVDSETPYLVMDYAPNGTLRQRHPKGRRLPLATITPYVKQIAAALQHAHNEKLIHRDVKPENMLLGRNNDVLLSDFGIALIVQSSRYQSTQEVIGTVAYMSPEQIQGKPRPASDQYSLGIVVYEWLSGDRPFHGSFTELCTQHMFAPPPPLREKVPTISPDVEQVVMTALVKDSHQRFGSVQAFVNALEQASQGPRPAFVPPQPVSPPAPSPLPPPVPSPAPQQLVGPPALPPMHYAGGTPLQEMRSPSNASYSTAAGPITGQSSGKIEQASIWRIGRQQIAAIIARVRPTTKPPVVYAVKPWSIDKRQVVAMLMSLAISVCLSILGALFALFVRSNPPPAVIIYIVGIVLLSLVLVTPEFFGAVFGPWVGLFTGGASLLAGAIIFANILALLIYRTLIPIDQYIPAYSSTWFVHIGFALTGFMSGFAMFKKKGRYNIGRTLGFSSLGAVAGSAFLIFVLFIQFHTGPYFVNDYLIPASIIALAFIVVGLILLPILLVIYNRITNWGKPISTTP